MKIACLFGMTLFVCATAFAQTNSYTVAPIVNNTQDPFMVNPWGVSLPVDPSLGENEWWLSDNATGLTTLYSVNKSGGQSVSPLVITIPTASGSGIGSPTGTAYNGVAGPGPGVNNFTFATLDGTISTWNAGTKPAPGGQGCMECHVTTTTVKVNKANKGASYFGLTINNHPTTGAPTYFASNFKGSVEAYDATTFRSVRLAAKFSDPTIPRSYKPYGIQSVGSKIWVSFFNETSGGGFVDSFDTNGRLLVRLAGGSFSEPWGMAQAPADFGAFSNMLLVGNTTSGMIGAYDPNTGAFQGFLQDSAGQPIKIPGIWGIGFGNGNRKAGPTNTLYYAAGGDDYLTGVFGAITAN